MIRKPNNPKERLHRTAENLFINNPLLQSNKVTKRKYQSNIFITCSKTNCLVVVPTGLGKTVIALLLAIHRLTKAPDSKVIFLAPTRPLVAQHLRTFREVTTLDEDHLVELTGHISPAKRKLLYESAVCLFMTPQVLQNDLITNRTSLKEVSLIIFDEAHRATGDYAYVFLAKKYFQQATNPKTLAMTASPGKNREKIQEVMQNLGLNAIEIRTEDDPDVKPYIQDVEIEWKEVELPPEMLELLAIFQNMLKEIFKTLKDLAIIDSADLAQNNRRELLAAVKSLDYRISQTPSGEDLPKLLYAKKGLANAMRISYFCELVEAQGIMALRAALDKNIKEIKDRKANKSLEELYRTREMTRVIDLVQKLTDKAIDHPKIPVLMSLLMDQFHNSPNSRILIFCQFRDTVELIVKMINKSDLVRAERFIGQQSKGGEKGMSQKEQLEMIERFKAGELNTLVATSVAEEGLDIAECDMVVFYDIIPSEIRAIQRRGRTGRKKAGKVVTLKTKGTREEGYFWAEKHREKEMKRILKEIQVELPVGDFSPPGQQNLNVFLQSKKTQVKSSKEKVVEPDENPSEFDITDENDNMEDRGELKQPRELEEPPESPSEDGLSSELIPISPMEQIELKTNEKPPIESPKEPPIWELNSEKLKDMEVYIMADSRETASPVVRELSIRNVALDIQTLPTGDYIVSERVGIERKAVPDLLSSIKDGRLFDELIRLKNQFALPILIIEGDLHNMGGIHPAALLGAISSIILNLNIYLYQAMTPIDTAAFIIALAKKEQNEPSEKKFSIRFKKLPDRIDAKLEFILAGIPGINASRAKDLLETFQTVQNIFNASAKDLQKAPNIGPVLAENIVKFGQTKYHSKSDKSDKIK